MNEGYTQANRKKAEIARKMHQNYKQHGSKAKGASSKYTMNTNGKGGEKYKEAGHGIEMTGGEKAVEAGKGNMKTRGEKPSQANTKGSFSTSGYTQNGRKG